MTRQVQTLKCENPTAGRRIQFVWAALAMAVTALWLWINYCRFPSYSWNDIRLVPIFMAAAGEPVYTLPGEGVLTTWMYGPVPLWIWSPALLGQTASSALLIANGVNLGLTILAIGLTCAYWPLPGVSRGIRWLAFAATVVVWPDHAFRFLQADNIAVALALFVQLLFVRSSRATLNRNSWIAAAATALALGSKQTAMGLLIAQLIWLYLEYDRRATLLHLVRTVGVSAIFAGAAIWQFGWDKLWFGVVTIASRLPMVDDPAERLISVAPILAVQLGAPLLAFLLAGKRIITTSHTLRLPWLMWLCSLPLGIFGLLSTGGSTNNLQGFHLIAAPLLLISLAVVARHMRTFYIPLTTAFILGIFSARILHADFTPIRPALGPVIEAAALHTTYPQQIWLPWNPLVSYFEEHAFYHSEDGIYVRFITGYPVTVTQARAHLPPHFHAMAFPSAGTQWHVADKLAGPDAQIRKIGQWVIIEWPL